jgi:replication initiation and membrane attachment protein DnaB
MSTFFPTTFFISKNIDNSNKDEILIEFFEEVLGKKTIELYKNFNSLFKKTQILKNNKCNINTISTKMQLSIEEIKNFQCSLEAFGLISVFKNVLDNSITVVINEIPDFSVISSNILLNSFIKKKIGLEKYEEYKSYFSHPFKDKTNFEDISTTAESFLNVNEYDISFIQDEAINKLLCSYFKMPIKYNDELNKIIVRMKKEFSIEKTTELLIASANIVQNMVEIDTKVLEEKANINRNIIQPLKTNTVYRNPKI